MQRKQQSGFTLIELIIVIVLTGVIGFGAVEMLRLGVQGQIRVEQIQEASWGGEAAIARIIDDLHQIASAQAISLASSQALTFTNQQQQTIRYTLVGNILQRDDRPLATHVSALAFSYFNAQGEPTTILTNIRYIKVSLTLDHGVAYTFTTGVFLWGAA